MKWSALAERVHQSLKQTALLKEEDKILVAVSGGMDSVVLLHVLLELRSCWKWELVLGHLDHGLRPGEDEEESDLCRTYAKMNGLIYREKRLSLKDTEIKAGNPAGSQNPSLESMARDLRYDNFETWAKELNCDAVCTGHHSGDQAETILYRMLTGSGLKGLRGIPASRDIYKRPLLSISKDEIRAYAEENELIYFNDTSNSDETFVRNRIRHKILPLLKESGFENIELSLASSAASLEEAATALDHYSRLAADDAICTKNDHPGLNRPAFESLPVFVQKQMIRRIYKDHLNVPEHISDKQMDQILTFLSGADTGATMTFRGVDILKDRDIFLWGVKANDKMIRTGKWTPLRIVLRDRVFDIEIINNCNIDLISPDNKTAYFSMNITDRDLTIRGWGPGDKMTLFGSGQTKKVSDILKDEKVSALKKEDHPVVLIEDEIAWIPGVKRSDLHKVDPTDDKLIRITYTRMENNNDQKDLNA